MDDLDYYEGRFLDNTYYIDQWYDDYFNFLLEELGKSVKWNNYHKKGNISVEFITKVIKDSLTRILPHGKDD